MRVLKVYLAAKFSRREELRTIAKWLRDHGYVVTSRWLEVEEDVLDSPESPEWAVRNVEDLQASDVVVSFAEVTGSPGAERGGRHAELGMALIAGKGAVLVGRPEHIFHTHPSVVVLDKVSEIPGALRAYAEAA